MAGDQDQIHRKLVGGVHDSFHHGPMIHEKFGFDVLLFKYALNEFKVNFSVFSEGMKGRILEN